MCHNERNFHEKGKGNRRSRRHSDRHTGDGRDWLIRNFDAREQDGFYLLDAGINTDNEHGYRLASGATAVPFEKCPGEEKLRVQAGNPHPYPNYPAMSLPFAAFIQYYR